MQGPAGEVLALEGFEFEHRGYLGLSEDWELRVKLSRWRRREARWTLSPPLAWDGRAALDFAGPPDESATMKGELEFGPAGCGVRKVQTNRGISIYEPV